MTNNQITFVYQSGRIERLKSDETFPLEFFYGLDYLKNFFKTYQIIEFYKDEFKNIGYYFSNLLIKISGLPFLFHKIMSIENYKIFKNSNVIVFSNQRVAFSSLPILIFLNLSRRNKSLVFVMGLFNVIHKNKLKNFLRKFFINIFIKNIDHLVFLSKGEYEYVIKNYSNMSNKFIFIPFSVDTKFWEYQKTKKNKNQILFIGNDGKRDYDFVIKLARKLKEFNFVFITNKIPINSNIPLNVELQSGSWHENTLSDKDIKKLYSESYLTIIPLKESLQPSGQSVALQSMSCGTPVMITKTQGFWEIENFKDEKNIFFVSENNIDLWEAKINNFFKLYKNDKDLVKSSIDTIHKNYSMLKFNSKIEELLF